MRYKYEPVPSFCSYTEQDYRSIILSTKGRELDYGSIYRIFKTNMTGIDLSSNYLTGAIPEEITGLEALVNLNLSRNHFSRNIPNRIGAMGSLESLDLSRKQAFRGNTSKPIKFDIF